MIELIAAALLQIAVITSDGTTAPSSDATTATTTTTTTDGDGTGGAGNWDDGN